MPADPNPSTDELEFRYIDPRQLEKNDYQYPHLPPVLLEQIADIQRTFAEVIPDPVEVWEDDFRRDAHPVREIERWLLMAKVYRHFMERAPLSLTQKKEVLAVLLTCCETPDRQEVVNRVPCRALSTKEVGNIIAYFLELAQEH